MSTNSNDARRSAEESSHRVAEDAQHAGHSIKRAIFGGSEAGDKMTEASTHGQNRACEVGNRLTDKMNEIATNISHAGSSSTPAAEKK